jgi:hypothetical protein
MKLGHANLRPAEFAGLLLGLLSLYLALRPCRDIPEKTNGQ